MFVVKDMLYFFKKNKKYVNNIKLFYMIMKLLS